MGSDIMLNSAECTNFTGIFAICIALILNSTDAIRPVSIYLNWSIYLNRRGSLIIIFAWIGRPQTNRHREQLPAHTHARSRVGTWIYYYGITRVRLRCAKGLNGSDSFAAHMCHWPPHRTWYPFGHLTIYYIYIVRASDTKFASHNMDTDNGWCSNTNTQSTMFSFISILCLQWDLC